MAFWIMLIWVLVIWYSNQNKLTIKNYNSLKTDYQKIEVQYCLLIMSVPFIIIALRTEFGDSGSYLGEFSRLSTASHNNFLSHVYKRDHSQLFYGLEFYFKKYISDFPQHFFIFIAFLHSFFLIKALRKYSPDFGMSVFIFIASSLSAQWMCNGVRQFIPVVILFACSDWIIKNKWYFYIPLAVFLMGLTPITSRLGLDTAPWYLCGIHQSALITIPIFFCIQGKPFNKKVWAVVLLLVALILTGGLDSVLDSSVENTTYVKDMQNVDADTGTSLLRVLFSIIPAILAFGLRKKISADETPEIIKISANASVITASLYVASAFTSGVYVGRLPIYTEIYNLILIPWIYMYGFTEDKKQYRPFILVLYVIFFFYQTNITWSGLYKSSFLGLGV